MRIPILLLTALAAISSSVTADDYVAIANWLQPGEGMDTIGNAHGDVAVSDAGEVYVSVGGPRGGVQVEPVATAQRMRSSNWRGESGRPLPIRSRRRKSSTMTMARSSA